MLVDDPGTQTGRMAVREEGTGEVSPRSVLRSPTPAIPDHEDEGGRQEQRRQQPAAGGLRQPLTAPAVIPATKYSTKKE